MQIEYADDEIRALITRGVCNKKYKKLASNSTFKRDLMNVVNILNITPTTSGLKQYGKLNYEKLKHDLSGKSSVRIGYGSKYRLIFEEFDNGIRICLIEVNEHYGDK